MWKRDFPSIYGALKEEWSPLIKPIITALQGKILVHVLLKGICIFRVNVQLKLHQACSHLLSSHPLLSIDKWPIIKGMK